MRSIRPYRWSASLVGLVCCLSGAAYAQARADTSETPKAPVVHQSVDDEPDRDAVSTLDSEARATEAFWEGKRLYELGDYAEARQSFEQAYISIKSPELLYNIAQTYRREGDCRHALQYFKAYVRDSTDSPLLAAAQQHIRDLKRICHSPRPEASTRASVPAPPPPASPPPPTRPSRGIPSRPAAHLRPWALAAAGAGLAAAGTSIGLALWNDARYDRWDERDMALSNGPEPGESVVAWSARLDENNALWNSIEGVDRTVAIVGIGAGALLVTSGVLYAWSLRRTDAGPPADNHGRVLPSLLITKASLSFSCQAAF